MTKRIISTILLILSAFWLPWWVSFIALLFLVFIFEDYYEAIIAGIVIDSLYGSSLVSHNFPLIMTLVFAVIVAGASQFKKQLI